MSDKRISELNPLKTERELLEFRQKAYIAADTEAGDPFGTRRISLLDVGQREALQPILLKDDGITPYPEVAVISLAETIKVSRISTIHAFSIATKITYNIVTTSGSYPIEFTTAPQLPIPANYETTNPIINLIQLGINPGDSVRVSCFLTILLSNGQVEESTTSPEVLFKVSNSVVSTPDILTVNTINVTGLNYIDSVSLPMTVTVTPFIDINNPNDVLGIAKLVITANNKNPDESTSLILKTITYTKQQGSAYIDHDGNPIIDVNSFIVQADSLITLGNIYYLWIAHVGTSGTLSPWSDSFKISTILDSLYAPVFLSPVSGGSVGENFPVSFVVPVASTIPKNFPNFLRADVKITSGSVVINRIITKSNNFMLNVSTSGFLENSSVTIEASYTWINANYERITTNTTTIIVTYSTSYVDSWSCTIDANDFPFTQQEINNISALFPVSGVRLTRYVLRCTIVPDISDATKVHGVMIMSTYSDGAYGSAKLISAVREGVYNVASNKITSWGSYQTVNLTAVPNMFNTTGKRISDIYSINGELFYILQNEVASTLSDPVFSSLICKLNYVDGNFVESLQTSIAPVAYDETIKISDLYKYNTSSKMLRMCAYAIPSNPNQTFSWYITSHDAVGKTSTVVYGAIFNEITLFPGLFGKIIDYNETTNKLITLSLVGRDGNNVSLVLTEIEMSAASPPHVELHKIDFDFGAYVESSSYLFSPLSRIFKNRQVSFGKSYSHITAVIYNNVDYWEVIGLLEVVDLPHNESYDSFASPTKIYVKIDKNTKKIINYNILRELGSSPITQYLYTQPANPSQYIQKQMVYNRLYYTNNILKKSYYYMQNFKRSDNSIDIALLTLGGKEPLQLSTANSGDDSTLPYANYTVNTSGVFASPPTAITTSYPMLMKVLSNSSGVAQIVVYSESSVNYTKQRVYSASAWSAWTVI